MNLAYYIVIFDHALDLAFEALDIGIGYRQRSGNSSFVAEAHTLYRREVTEGERVRVTTRLLAGDAKRIHLFQTMLHAGDSQLVATHEQMCLHIDMRSRRVAPWPADRLAALTAAARDDAALRWPEQAGRRIAMPGHEVR